MAESLSSRSRSGPRHVLTLAQMLAVTVVLSLTASGCITLELGGSGSRGMHETVVLGAHGPKVLMLDIDGEITSSDAAGVLGWVLSEKTRTSMDSQAATSPALQMVHAVLSGEPVEPATEDPALVEPPKP